LAACCEVKDESEGEERLEKNRRMILECLDRAKEFRPDFVVFSEISLHLEAVPTTEAMKRAETIPGSSTEMVAEKARELGSYVWLPMFEKLDGKMFNSVALIDRGGEVAGVYRKVHATGREIEDGVQPGEEVPVWETDRGRVGCAVCFDLKYPEVGLRLSRGKAQVVFLAEHVQRRSAPRRVGHGLRVLHGDV
jgi:nitrilase